MPYASVKRLIECKKDQLVNLVLDIEKYPEFVPFCLDAHVYEKKDQGNLVSIIADLTIGKGPFKDTYKSDVKFNKKNNTIKVTNIGGPLNHLENTWHFKEHESCTEIAFDIDWLPDYKIAEALYYSMHQISKVSINSRKSLMKKKIPTKKAFHTLTQ